MKRKEQLKLTLIAGLVALALGGWLLHVRTHPPFAEDENLIPFVAGIISIVIVPLMFWFKKTSAYAYVLNGFMVILGTITMAHFSIVHMSGPVSAADLLFKTMLPDILMLWANFAMGKAIFDLELLNSATDVVPQGRWFRYPNNGWWLAHLAGWSMVYALGNIIWK
ncbi:MAG TPA: hypothetical protein VMD02_03755 [Candidatus Omnitrophota bacterium]|nr:hypothetical protein [Candidatus Omnitrophota bacterium]